MRQPLTLEAIRTLVVKQHRFDNLYLKEVGRKQQIALGREPSAEAPETIKVEKALFESMADVTSARLFEGDTSKPLLSDEDTDILTQKMVGYMVDELASREEEEVPASELEEMKMEISVLMCAIVKNMIHAVREGIEATRLNPHETFWKWVQIVSGSAADRQISVDEFLASDDAYVVITRQMYSREQFERRAAYALTKFDGDKYTNAVLEPLLQLIADPEEREKKLTEALEETRPEMEKVRNFLRSHNDAEILRIYGAP